MLTEGSSRASHLPSIHNAEQIGPYLLQYKVFDERLKKQERKGRVFSHQAKEKKPKSYLQEDFMELTKNILSKKEYLNLLQNIPLETEPNSNQNICSDELVTRTRMLFEKKIDNKKKEKRLYREEPILEQKENANNQRSRIKSQSNTHVLRNQKNKQNSRISFIGYKKNKKPIVQMEFRRILGFV